MAFPATEFTASDDGLAGATTTRKPPTTRASTALRACPKLPLRAVDGNGQRYEVGAGAAL